MYRKCSMKRALSARPIVEFRIADIALCIRPSLVSVDGARRNVLRISDVGSTRRGGANERIESLPYSLLLSDVSAPSISPGKLVSRQPSPVIPVSAQLRRKHIC